MVAVVRPSGSTRCEAVLRALGAAMHASIGEVTDDRRAARVLGTTRSVGEIPARAAHGRVPALRGRPPRSRHGRAPPSTRSISSRRRWIYEQYDQLVGSRTVRRPGLDAAVLRLRPSWRGLAVSLDGPPLG